jgi:hypothetical protein
MSNSLEICGYHGTSRAKARNILENGFFASDNDYDWLGTGIYFFRMRQSELSNGQQNSIRRIQR